MVFPNRKIVENIRREYPVGTRVELVRMHDKQAPPVGMTGTVLGVDDTASLLMHWDNGSGLNVIYGEDCVKKIPIVRTICYGKTEEAKKEWKRMAKQMEQLGILTEIDMAAFAGYCQAYARWKEAEEFITQHGTIVKTPSGYWQQVPQVSIAQTYLKIMNKFCEQFGLTPSARSRIVTDNGDDKESDAMELLLIKGGGG